MPTTQAKPYSVTAITKLIKGQLEEMFGTVWVTGELTGYLHHRSGHHYFSLKDPNAVLKCVMWRSVGQYLKFQPENGQQLIAQGDITVYEKGGQYQLNVRKLIPVGVGELELAFRQLYERLSAEGLFDDSRKRPIPEYPTRIGVVTSPTGAAIRDIIQIARRRNPAVQLVIYPAQVQGDGAERTIAEGIRYFSDAKNVDLIITGRGGGSLEDLWCFNTETVVRAIVASELPVVSAVGHEVDTTLADLAADLRAPTPSAAAELTVWSRSEFAGMIRGQVAVQTAALRERLVDARATLAALRSRPVFARPERLIADRRQHLDTQIRLLAAGGKSNWAAARSRLSLAISRLETLSPLAILKRGYAVLRIPETGEPVRSAEAVPPGTRLDAMLADGTLRVLVEKRLGAVHVSKDAEEDV